MTRRGGVLAYERLDVARVLGRRPRCPLHLHRHHVARRALQDDVDLLPAAGAVEREPAGAQVLQPPPQIQHHPLLETASGVCAHNVGAGVRQETAALFGIDEVVVERGRGEKPRQQSRLAGLAGPEKDVDERLAQVVGE